MSKTFEIWKFVLSSNKNRIKMPAGAMILRTDIQGSSLCIWAQVDRETKTETREFHVFNTGEIFRQPDDVLFSYIGTVFYSDGIVVHVYEYLKIDEPEEEDEIPF